MPAFTVKLATVNTAALRPSLNVMLLDAVSVANALPQPVPVSVSVSKEQLLLAITSGFTPLAATNESGKFEALKLPTTPAPGAHVDGVSPPPVPADESPSPAAPALPTLVVPPISVSLIESLPAAPLAPPSALLAAAPPPPFAAPPPPFAAPPAA
jgi:hypothetical protein